MIEVYLTLGSNVGDSPQNIAHAIQLLRASIQGIKQAPLYKSKAVGSTDQPDFINTAISGQTNLTPEMLLEFVKDVEQSVGRTERFHLGPREIDIDIIFYGNQVTESAELTIPHPAFRDRDFVLQPLLDLNPRLVDPQTKQSLKQLIVKASKSIVSQVD